ncbi:hypothetical protein M0802_000957 [Mischocyttarus mexicanus]|nr:hypothetical protein M0802_000957 [Mischocyttarus mexicanus]
MLTDMTPAAAGQLYPQLQSIAKSPAHGHVICFRPFMVTLNEEKGRGATRAFYERLLRGFTWSIPDALRKCHPNLFSFCGKEKRRLS